MKGAEATTVLLSEPRRFRARAFHSGVWAWPSGFETSSNPPSAPAAPSSLRAMPPDAMQHNVIRLQQAGKKIGHRVTPRAAMMTERSRHLATD